MRIAFVTPEYVSEQKFHGGLANYLQRTCQGLVQSNHEPAVFVVSDKTEQMRHTGITVYRVNCYQKWINALNRLFCGGKTNSPLRWVWQSYTLKRQIQKIHAQSPFDIIQYTNYTAVSFFKIKTIPSVTRISSYQPLLRDAYGFTKPTFTQQCLEKLEHIALKHSDYLFGPSKKISALIAEHTGKQVTVIPSPIAVPALSSSDDSLYRNQLSGKKYFLFFGTIGILKGVDIIAECINRFLSKYNDVYFVFIGKDVGFKRGITMMDHIRACAVEHSERILHFSPLPHSVLFPIIRNARAVVLPSRIDNFPNTCLEAMALGNIVVGSHGTSFEEIITDGHDGFLCNPADAQSLLNCLCKTADLSEQDKKRIEQNALLRIKEFDTSKTIALLTAYYEKVSSS